MAKAILVMDMPDRCDDCDLWDYDIETDLSYCGSWSGRGRLDDTSNKPDWCPLIPEPEKLRVWVASPDAPIDQVIQIYYNLGWNACLDALEGKENE